MLSKAIVTFIKSGQTGFITGDLEDAHAAGFQSDHCKEDPQQACFRKLTRNLTKHDTPAVQLIFNEGIYISRSCINYKIQNSGANTLQNMHEGSDG